MKESLIERLVLSSVFRAGSRFVSTFVSGQSIAHEVAIVVCISSGQPCAINLNQVGWQGIKHLKTWQTTTLGSFHTLPAFRRAGLEGGSGGTGFWIV